MQNECDSPLVGNSQVLQIRGQSVEVRDPSLRKVLKTASAFKPILQKFQSGVATGDRLEDVAKVLEDDGTFEALKLCASACTDKDAEFFDDIGVAETVELINALKSVVDWTQLKKLLFQLAEQGKTLTT